MGNLTNLEKFKDDVEFNANYRYGYSNILTVADAQDLVSSVVSELNLIYQLNPHLEKILFTGILIYFYLEIMSLIKINFLLESIGEIKILLIMQSVRLMFM